MSNYQIAIAFPEGHHWKLFIHILKRTLFYFFSHIEEYLWKASLWMKYLSSKDYLLLKNSLGKKINKRGFCT